MVTCSVPKSIGYPQCPPDHNVADPELLRATEGSLLGSIIRVVGGYKPERGVWSRTHRSAQISTNLELGWAHMASKVGDAQPIVFRIATEHPALSASAWGAMRAEVLQDELAVDEIFETFLHQKSLPDAVQLAFIDGWSVASQYAESQRIYAEQWFQDYCVPVITWMDGNGLKLRRTLATGCRLRNTSNVALGWLKDAVMAHGEAEGTRVALDRYRAKRKSYVDDADKLEHWVEFDGEISRWPDPGDLDYDAFSSFEGRSSRTLLTLGLALGLGAAYTAWRKR